MAKRASPKTETGPANFKLVSACDGQRFDFIEPSLACAAQHALAIVDGEEGCIHSIESGGKTIWELDPNDRRASLEKLEELAQGECVR